MMVKTVFVLFQKPQSVIGDLITWRLSEQWSHTAIVVDGRQYNATLLRGITADDLTIHPDDRILAFELTERQFDAAFTYLLSEVGRSYDVLSVLGWIFSNNRLRMMNCVHCFQYTRNFFVAAGLLKPEYDLIKPMRVHDELMPLALSSPVCKIATVVDDAAPAAMDEVTVQ